MARRPLSNTALWALEDAYAALLTIEREVAPLMSDHNQPTRTEYISTMARVRVTAANARANIIEAHPSARTKSQR